MDCTLEYLSPTVLLIHPSACPQFSLQFSDVQMDWLILNVMYDFISIGYMLLSNISFLFCGTLAIILLFRITKKIFIIKFRNDLKFLYVASYKCFIYCRQFMLLPNINLLLPGVLPLFITSKNWEQKKNDHKKFQIYGMNVCGFIYMGHIL